jgi:DNA polymerase III subunit beta
MPKSTDVSVSVPLKPFAEAFAKVAAATPARTTKEILKSVRIDVDPARKSLSLFGTDSEISVQIDLPDVDAAQPVSALLPAARLSALLRELTIETLGLEFHANPLAVYVTSGLNEWKLSIGDVAEFPPLPAISGASLVTLGTGDLVRCLNRTVFATDVESTRYALGGVLFELKPDRATFAATDSRRLAIESCKVIRADGDLVTGVVPAKAVKLVASAASGSEATIAMTGNAVSVTCGGTTVVSQLVQGRFPDFRKVIPQRFNATVVSVVGPLLSAVRQSLIVTNEESRGVDFVFSDGVLKLSSKAADVGQANIELPISYAGQDLSITFDPRYIADFLRVLESGEQIDIRLIDRENAALFCTGGGYQYVVMPLSRDG